MFLNCLAICSRASPVGGGGFGTGFGSFGFTELILSDVFHSDAFLRWIELAARVYKDYTYIQIYDSD